MKLSVLICSICCCFIAGCSVKPADIPADTMVGGGSLSKAYFDKIDENKCLSVIFPEFRIDSIEGLNASGDCCEFIKGKVDTIWCSSFGKFSELVSNFDAGVDTLGFNPNTLNEGVIVKKGLNQKKIFSYFVDYKVNQYVGSNKFKVLVYSVRNLNIKNYPNAVGVAVFECTPKGWTIIANKPDFYKRVAMNHNLLSVSFTDSNNKKPLLVFLTETVDKQFSPERALLVTDALLVNQSTTPSENLEFYGGKWKDNGGNNLSRYDNKNTGRDFLNESIGIYGPGDSFSGYADAAMKELFGPTNDEESRVDSCYVSYSINSHSKQIVGLLARTHNNKKPLLVGRIVEVKTPANSKGIELYYKPSGLWKNYLQNKIYYFGAIPTFCFTVLGSGNIKDSVSIINFADVRAKETTARLEAERVAASAAYAERTAIDAEQASARKQRDEYFGRMRDQQYQDRAVDEIIRKAGLCSFCSGRGCLQCADTGRRQ